MEVIQLGSNRSAWDGFARSSGDAWFWHTTSWMDYTEEHSKGKHLANLSFSIVENQETLAICPVILEQSNSAKAVKQFSFSGGPIPFPALRNGLSPEKRQRVFGLYIHSLESLAQKEDVGYVWVRVPAFATAAGLFLGNQAYAINPLLRYGYIDLPYLSQVIDLSKDPDVLWREIRKGHKADIKRASKTCAVQVWDRHTITDQKFQEYQHLHAKDAGRVTRSQRTFDQMLSWVRQGDAILVESEHQEQAVGFSLIILFGTGAYYGSSCKDPDFAHIPASHLIQWRTMCWLKEHDYRWYDIGLQHLSPQWFDPASPKEISIAGFKRGFGGTTIPLMTAEFFYSKALLQHTFQERLHRYLEALDTAPVEA